MKTQQPTQEKNSSISFLDYGNWKSGHEIMTVLLDRPDGTQTAIGHIYFTYDIRQRRMIYTSRNHKGGEAFPPHHRLSEIKMRFLEREHEITAELNREEKDRDPQALEKLVSELGGEKKPEHTQSIASPYAKHIEPSTEPKAKSTGKKIADIRKEKVKKAKDKSIKR